MLQNGHGCVFCTKIPWVVLADIFFEILHEILRFAQDDKAKAQDDKAKDDNDYFYSFENVGFEYAFTSFSYINRSFSSALLSIDKNEDSVSLL